MQQIKPVQTIQTIQPVGIGQLPAPKKPTDKAIYPVNDGTSTGIGQMEQQPQIIDGYAKYQTPPINKQPIDDSGTVIGSGLLGKAQQMATTKSTPNPVPPQPGTPSTGGSENSAWVPPKTTNNTQAIDNSQYQVPTPAPIQNNFTPAQYQSVTGDALANAPKANVQDNTFTPNEYQNVGTDGVTSDKQYQYDPRNESLVQNQITGLLDPNSDIMRKAIAQAQGYSAARGLQSSSIGNEVALSSMIDKAMPIAQQDAQTFNQAQSQGWQNQFTSDQTNVKNQQDAAMADKQGAINNQLQNNQMGWQTSEKNADRQFQAELEDLKYKQSLGTLDAQGQQRLQELNAQQSWQTGENNVNREFQTQLEDLKYKQQLGTLDKQQSLQLAQMERSAQIQTDRDSILQQYQVQLNELQNDQRWKELNAQIDANFETQTRGFDQQTKMEYGNAQSQAVNAAMQAIGMAMSNPNMTADQQKAAVANIMGTLQSQANMLAVIYGAASTTPPPLVTPPPATGNTGSTGSTGSTGNSGGSSGGSGGSGGGSGGSTKPAQQQR